MEREMEEAVPAQLRSIIGFLRAQETLIALQGACKELDKYFGMVGPDTWSEILSEGLPTVFERDSALCAQARAMVEPLACSGRVGADLSSDECEAVAALLATIIDGSDELRGEMSHVLAMPIWSHAAAARRKGEATVWTRLEDQQHDELLMQEYAGIEAKILDRLKTGLRSDMSTAQTKDLLATREPEQDRLPPVQSSPNPETKAMSWWEMQALFTGSDPATFGPAWRKEPRRTFLWILQHGSQEQCFAYVYKHAGELDDEFRGWLLDGLRADDQEEIPRVWRTALIRALSRARNSSA